MPFEIKKHTSVKVLRENRAKVAAKIHAAYFTKALDLDQCLEAIKPLVAEYDSFSEQIEAEGETRAGSETRLAPFHAALQLDEIMSTLKNNGSRIVSGATQGDVDRSWGSSNGQRVAAITPTEAGLVGILRLQAGLPVAAEIDDGCRRAGISINSGGLTIPLRLNDIPVRGSHALNFSATAASDPMQSFLGSRGGYTIPTTLMDTFTYALKAFGPMLQVAELVVTEDGRIINWPTIDDTAQTGVQIGENAENSETAITIGQRQVGAYRFSSGILRIPYTLIRDSALNLLTEFGKTLGTRLARILNTRMTTGTGAATITGIVTGAPSALTAAAQTAVTMDELIRLQHAIDPAYRGPGMSSFMFNSNTASYLRRLKDGDGEYLWQNSVIEGQPSLLLGDAVFINQDMPDMTTGLCPILYGNLPSYKARLVGEVRLVVLKERYGEYDQVGVIAYWEGDGFLMKPSSTDSLSPVQKLTMA
jgi:HK97 family phage major capsid protein